MPRKRTRSGPVNQNWTKDEVITLIKKDARTKLAECKQREVGHTVIFVPHPTLPRTMIQKII